jgi:hypothetical protein
VATVNECVTKDEDVCCDCNRKVSVLSLSTVYFVMCMSTQSPVIGPNIALVIYYAVASTGKVVH